MAITFDNGRQVKVAAHMPFVLADLTTGVYVGMIKLPINSIVTDARVVITTLFDSATTDKFSIGDRPSGASARDTQYAAQSADVTAVPTEIVGKMTGAKYTANTTASPNTIGVRWDGAGGGTTTGAGTLFVEYVIDGRATEDNP